MQRNFGHLAPGPDWVNYCHMVFYIRFRAKLCLQFSIGIAWGGPLFDWNKRQGSKLRLLFKSFPGPLLKSGVGPVARYGSHQKITSRRPEKMYTSSGMAQRGAIIRVGPKSMGPLFESPPRPLLKSGLGPLGRYGTHQETV